MDPARPILLNFPGDLSFVSNSPLTQNYTILLDNVQQQYMNNRTVVTKLSELDYDKFVTDIWIGVILTVVIVFTVFSLCTCFMYHKFQQWKINYNARLAQRNPDSSLSSYDIESLPNYSLVSGLPSYDDALEQFRKDKSYVHNEKPPIYCSLRKLYTKPESPTSDDAHCDQQQQHQAASNRMDYLQVKEATFKFPPHATSNTKKRFSIAVSSGDLLSKTLWPPVQQRHQFNGDAFVAFTCAGGRSPARTYTDAGESGPTEKSYRCISNRIVLHRASLF